MQINKNASGPLLVISFYRVQCLVKRICLFVYLNVSKRVVSDQKYTERKHAIRILLACTSDSKKVSLQNAATRTESCSCYCILGYNRRAQICESAAHCYNLVQCCVLISLLAQDKVDRLNGFHNSEFVTY